MPHCKQLSMHLAACPHSLASWIRQELCTMLPVRREELAPNVATGFEAYVATQVLEERHMRNRQSGNWASLQVTLVP